MTREQIEDEMTGVAGNLTTAARAVRVGQFEGVFDTVHKALGQLEKLLPTLDRLARE